MKKLLLLLVATISMVACQQTPASYEVRGTLPDSTNDGKTIYMLRWNDDKFIDSTIVNGSDFIFEGVIDEPALCRIDVGRTFANFILENNVYEIDFNTHTANSTSLLNMEYIRMNAGEDSLRVVIDAKMDELAALTDNQQELARLQQEYYKAHFEKDILDYYKGYFLANKNNDVGTGALVNYSQYATPEEMDEVFAQAGEWMLSRDNIKRLVKRNEALKNTAAGKPFVDFSIEQEDGTTVSLSDYVGKGKYVLVDFWASWCGPCIRETPVIAEVYNKYKGKNFEVLGVAVWDKADKTREAIEKHNITWPQILNAQSIPTELYGIDGIPHIILFAPDGTIVERSLRDEVLRAKVAEVMEN